jgi:hypothetical protein
MRYLTIMGISLLTLVSLQSVAEEKMQHHGHHMSSPLTEAGNDAFGTIQEVVVKLLANPDTDWDKVDLEALRQHLIDMENFTIHVKVLETRDIDNGVEFSVKGTSKGAYDSLQRMFSAHPAILKQESGWDMQVTENRNKTFTAQVTTTKPAEVAMIRGLGYIGIIAYGQHHQLHHWQMATGKHPHQH